MTLAVTLRCSQREGRPHSSPLLALSSDVLAAGTCEMVVTYALTARGTRVMRLADMKPPPGTGQYAALALDPRGTALAVLLVDDRACCVPRDCASGECVLNLSGMEGKCSPGALVERSAALLLYVPETLRLLAKVELPSLPSRDVLPTPLFLTSRPDGRPGLLVFLPSFALLLRPNGNRLSVERNLRLELPIPVAPGRIERSRPFSYDNMEVDSRAVEHPVPCATAVHAVSLLSVEPNAAFILPQDFAAVCFDDGGVAIYEVLHLRSYLFEKPHSIAGSPTPCSRNAEVPVLISYVGRYYRILAVSKVVRPCGALGAVAIALACCNKVANASEEPISQSEETRSPPSAVPDATQTLKPDLCWVALSGHGENGSCEVVQVLSGADSLLTAQDFPLSCSVAANGAVHVVSQRGAILELYPATDPACESRVVSPSQLECASDHSPTVFASCVSSGSRLATMRKTSAHVSDAHGDPLERYEIQLVTSV